MTANRRFVQLKPSQLILSMSFPEREYSTPLGSLMAEILEYGILCPLIVRPSDDNCYVVLKGRRVLKAVWELQNNGHEKQVRWLPCYVIESDSPLMDLKLFLLLNNQDFFSPGDVERTLTCIEQAQSRLPRDKALKTDQV